MHRHRPGGDARRALTTGEVTEYCGVNLRTLIRWIDKGHLPAYKLPGRGNNRVRLVDSLNFADRHGIPVPQALQSSGNCVLVVDDEEPMANSIARTLKAAGLETRIALAHPGRYRAAARGHAALKVAWNELEYKAEVIRNLDPVPPLRGKPGESNQVIPNLLVIAGQALKDFGEVRIRTRQLEGDVPLSVADNGRGIAPADMERLFTPSFTTKPASKGTGLGLAISRDIITAHGGRIEVQSRPGEGAELAVFLPIPTEAGDGSDAWARADGGRRGQIHLEPRWMIQRHPSGPRVGSPAPSGAPRSELLDLNDCVSLAVRLAGNTLRHKVEVA